MSGLKVLLKPLLLICTFVLPILLFLMLLRVYNGREAFFGLNDFNAWLEKQDFYNPISTFVNFVENHQMAMQDSLNSLGASSNFFEWIGSLFRVIAVAVGYLSYPVVFLYEVIDIFVKYIIMFFDLISYATFL